MAFRRDGGCRTATYDYAKNWNGMERPVREGENPVQAKCVGVSRILSRSGHEKPRLKPAGPPAKAKHSAETDSEPVP